jgi:hypothetical protein
VIAITGFTGGSVPDNRILTSGAQALCVVRRDCIRWRITRHTHNRLRRLKKLSNQTHVVCDIHNGTLSGEKINCDWRSLIGCLCQTRQCKRVGMSDIRVSLRFWCMSTFALTMVVSLHGMPRSRRRRTLTHIHPCLIHMFTVRQ